MNKFYFSFLFLVLTSVTAFAQPEEITMQTGAVSMCDGVFLDSGGNTGDYSAGENFTLTICPEIEGDVVYVEFLSVNLSCPNPNPNNANYDCDVLEVFDGENLTANSMGTVTGPITFTASPLNPSGCLTFRFTSNAAAEMAGWAATVTCETPCERPIAEATTDPGGEFPIKVCVGEEIEFDGSASYAAPGFNITDWEWDFRDGTTDTSGPIVTHAYGEPGEYVVQLYLVDDNGCASTNRTDIQIWVGTPPNVIISNSLDSYEICPDQELCLSIDAASLGVQWDALPAVELGTGITVPDIVGECFDSELEYNSFEPGQTLNSVDDLLAIYVNMEHSFMGDLLIQITCPDGTTVNLHEQGGGVTNLGDANQADDQVPGTGWDYWWAHDAELGTWSEESASNTTTAPGGSNSLISDTYSTVGDLTDLVGCPLNGIWSVSMCDLWGADDGTVFGWSLELNPDLYPELTTFTPVYGSDADSTFWTGDSINFTSASQDSICISHSTPGSYDYDFFMMNDFGCSYDTIVTVVVKEPLDVNAGEDALIQCDEPYALNAFLNATPTDECDYNLVLLDSWGNGWLGGEVELVIDGVSTTYTPDNDISTSFPITVPHEGGIELYYTAGDTDAAANQEPGQNEITFFNSNNVLLFQDGEFGAVPTEGLVYTATAYCYPPEPDLEYSWTPAEQLANPNSQNPTVLGLTEATTFTVELWEPDYPGCPYSAEVTLTVAGALDAGEDIIGCEMSYTLEGSSLSNGEWTAPAGSGVTFTNPASGTTTVTADTAGTYTLTWTDLDGLSCPTSSTIDVVFFDGILIQPVINEPICNGQCNGEVNIVADGGSIAPGTEYIYVFSEGELGINPGQIVNLCSGNYNVSLEDNYGCISELDFFVSQPPAPVIDSIISERESCLGFCDGALTVYSPVAVGYSFNGGSSFVSESLNDALCGGQHEIVIRDANDCEATMFASVSSPVAPEALFAADPVNVTIFEPQVTFTNFSSNNISNEWLFGSVQQAGFSTETDPVFSFPAITGTYTVELVVTDSIGCQDSSHVDIQVAEEFMIHVPSAFSPNEDGINDLFSVNIQDLDPTDYLFQIFDRWGNVVYETSEYPSTWNGQGAHSENYYVTDGVYIWRIEARSLSTTERQEKMGTVTVIR